MGARAGVARFQGVKCSPILGTGYLLNRFCERTSLQWTFSAWRHRRKFSLGLRLGSANVSAYRSNVIIETLGILRALPVDFLNNRILHNRTSDIPINSSGVQITGRTYPLAAASRSTPGIISPLLIWAQFQVSIKCIPWTAAVRSNGLTFPRARRPKKILICIDPTLLARPTVARLFFVTKTAMTKSCGYSDAL